MNNRWKHPGALLWLAIALASTSLYAQTPPGVLDPSFGVGGIVTTDFAGGGDGAAAIAVQTDGKLVVAGGATINGNPEFAVARYNSNGTLDVSFGIGGKATTDVGGRFESARAVALQGDGKIVVAGETVIGLFSDFAVVRFNSNGTLDTSFGTGGIVLTDFGVSIDVASVAVQADGKIVVARSANINGGYNFELVRYNSNGTLDASFGAGGKVTTDFGLLAQGFSFAMANSLALQQDGKLVLAGQAYIGAYNFALARYNSNGMLDSGFGTGGKVTTPFATQNNAANVAAFSVALQPDGKILAAGLAGFDNALARYNSNGTLDTSFGTGGTVISSIGPSYDSVFSVAVQSDGKIVASGRTFVLNDDFHSFLARYNSSGTLDTTFGTGGRVINVFGVALEGVSSVAILPDGEIVAAGGVSVSGNSDFAVARFNSGGGSSTPTTTPPPTSGFAPIRVNAAGAAYTDASGNLWAADSNPIGYTFGTGANIGNTTTMPLYQTERWYTAPLQYVFSVPNATYTVTLKFAEIYFTTCGHRVFNIAINGTTVDANFDPCAAGGGPNMAADRTYTVPVSGGQIAITLTPVLDNPTISAIEIR